MYPLFPGLECAREGAEKFRIAEVRRLRDGLDSQTSWGLMLMACAQARARDGESALRCFDLTARAMLMGNLFTVHNDWRGMGIGLEMGWAPFQIDANMGWTAAVLEMLVYSDAERLELLPALPERWHAGSVGPVAARCGVEVTICWRDGHAEAELCALRAARVRLTLGAEARELRMSAGERMSVEWDLAR